MLLAVIINSSDFPLLRKLAEDVKVSTYLTDSSVKTKQLFKQGLSIEQIVASRKLKRSTIEDHFVEMSINDPDFPLANFVSVKDAEAVIKKVNGMGNSKTSIVEIGIRLIVLLSASSYIGGADRREIDEHSQNLKREIWF